MRYEHVVFDLDGTLIDSRADLAQAVNHVLQAHGLAPLPLDVVTSYIGEGARMLVKKGLGPAYEDRLQGSLEMFMEYYGKHLLDHTQLYPGIADTLTVLAAHGVTLSVLSNKPEAMSRAILDGLGVLSLFSTVLGGDSFPARKPDPAGVDRLRALTGTAPQRMLMVGDSVIDLRTARAAGVDFRGVSWGFGLAGLREAGAEPVITAPAQLAEIVTA